MKVDEIKPSDIFVVIPVFNEAGVVAGVIDGITSLGYQVIAIDDGSTDSSYKEILKTNTISIRHPVNLGQGAAIQTGISYALQKTNAKYIVTFDSDGQHAPDDILYAVRMLVESDLDVVIGSRFLTGGKAVNIPSVKKCILMLALWLTIVTTGLKLTDTHNGFRVFSREAAEKIKITQNRMAHASQILILIKKKCLKYAEFPVTIYYTDYSKQKGQSIMNSINIVWDILISRE
jgi:glycosyltransferase involved in cell wall biosynthesis